MNTLINITIQTENKANKILITKVDGNMSIKDFISAIAEKAGLPIGTHAIISIKEREINPLTISLLEANISSGDILFIDFERTAGKGFCICSFPIIFEVQVH